MSLISPVEMVACLAAGAALGLVYFYAIYQTVRLHVAKAAASRIIVLYLVRGGAAVVVFWTVAQRGPLPLIVTLFGFLIARFLVRRLAGNLS